MKRFFVLLLFAFLSLAHADGLKPEVIGLHLASQHFNTGGANSVPGGYNNFNPGVYVRWHNGATAGFYRNSLNRPSVYLGWTVTEPWLNMFSLTVGAVSGYEVKTYTFKLHEGCTGFVDAGGFCRGDLFRWDTKSEIKHRIRPLIAPSVRIGLARLSPSLSDTSLRLTLLAPPHSAKALHLSIEKKF